MISSMSILRSELADMFLATCDLATLCKDEEMPHQENTANETMLLRRIGREMKRHNWPAVVIGSGRSSLPHTFHSFMHALLLECPRPTSLCALLREIFALTSDQGVEFSITRVRPITLQEVFPWLQLPDQGDDGAWLDADDNILDLTHSVAIPGMLHVVHNSTKDLEKSMRTYKQTVYRMQHVCNMVRRKATKERLVATCFSEGPAACLKRDIEKFNGHVHKERWGTIADCALKMLRIERALCNGWSLEAYGRARRGIEIAGGDEAWQSEVEVVDEAINDPLFWDALRVLTLLAKLVIESIVWSESCSCHGDLDWENCTSEERARWRSCPLRGMRASDLAAGLFFRHFANLAATYAIDLAGALSRDLTPQQRGILIQDFEQGRAHLFAAFTLRLSPWQQPHLLVFGCAHQDPNVALRCLRGCFASPCWHPWVRRLQGGLHEEVQGWVAGEDRNNLPALCTYLGEMRFAFTAEMPIEAEHALAP